MKKKQLPKTIAIILICVLIDIALHSITSTYSTMPENPNYSKIAGLFGTEITATFWALLAFSGAAFVFYRIQSSIPGVGLAKGFRYGTAISLLWLFAMLEGAALFGNAIINEFVVGISDAIPAFLLGILLSLSIAKKGEHSELKQLTLSQKILTVCVFTGVFLMGRYVAYFTGLIQSGHQASPFYTFLWTLLMGAWIGAACILLVNPGNTLRWKPGAKIFIMFFGINWATFLIFMPLLFSGFIADVLSRIILDILLVTIGYYLAFSLRMKCIKDVISKMPESAK
ncbi:MAG TPA: hypothetical protein PKN87_08550 [Syntrophomonadaceae bacterium]|nr:hypothetical protein [Syntrophomonadaceae bacterium]HNX29442.1 hypothetical protein [Syntrophomonadaceae bacterium]HPR93822.1 hypothetical protein [Syntrophomonadaceae bacterium]